MNDAVRFDTSRAVREHLPGTAAPLPEIAVLIPCYNEEKTVATVIQGFRSVLPGATIYVYDNNSTDATFDIARQQGAIVYREPLQGKGNVVRRMFCDIEADIYVLVDGDATYDASFAPAMVRALVEDQLDMVNGKRVTEIVAAYRPGHRLGNTVFTSIVRYVFGDRINDMLSGYRVFSRRFVKTFPVLSSGFEIETELTIHALDLAMPLGEIDTPYRDRPVGSLSKLRTYRDGIYISRTIVSLIKEIRPLQFFSVVAGILLLLGLILGFPVILEYRHTHLVPRFPTAILATGIITIAVISAFCGLMLDSVAKGRREMKRLAYMSIASPGRFAESVREMLRG